MSPNAITRGWAYTYTSYIVGAHTKSWNWPKPCRSKKGTQVEEVRGQLLGVQVR